MNHLSGMDAAFLHMETPETPMHVGGLILFELPAGYTGDYYEDVKAHIARRMHLASVFTRKLALMPFELANPVWVEDDDIDLDYHIRRVVLSRPGTMAQVEAYVGRLHSSLLDRSRPLWEFYVIEGLASGQVGFYIKAHHAAMDGAAGAVLATAILDATAVPRTVKPPRARRLAHEPLGVAELAGAALKNTAVQYVKLARLLPAIAKVALKIALPPKDEHGKRAPRLPKGWALGPRTSFNVTITNQRVFAAQSMPLAEVKSLARQLDVTLNDIVMALCSGALRRYLEQHDGVPAKSLVAGVPVSVREAGNTDMNNQATVMLVSLSTNVEDPLERLKAINAAAVDSKRFTGSIKAAIPMDFPSFGAPWLVTGLVSLLGRTKLVNSLPPVSNLVISNVPGPQVPLYMAGAKMVTNYPVSIPAHGMALNITVQSYNGSLDFGLTACRRAVPDVRDIADHLMEALAELKAAVQARGALSALSTGVAVTQAAVPALVALAVKPRKTAAAGPRKKANGAAPVAPPAPPPKAAAKRLRRSKPATAAH